MNRVINPAKTNPSVFELLEECRHVLTTEHGLIAADGAAPEETFKLDNKQLIAKLDRTISSLQSISAMATPVSKPTNPSLVTVLAILEKECPDEGSAIEAVRRAYQLLSASRDALRTAYADLEYGKWVEQLVGQD